MKIHALQTGTVELKQAFLHPRPGAARRLGLLLPGAWAASVPIHAWLIEHDAQRVLVDTGETAAVRNLPFARYHVTPGDELPQELIKLDLTTADVDLAVVTHLHSDHADGAVHLDQPVLVSEDEWRFAHSRAGRLAQRIARAPLPVGVTFRPVALQDGPFGCFAASSRLTDDGRVVAVATPGHTPGHISVIAVDDDGRHVLLAADATDSLEQLHARRPDAVAPDPKQMIETIDRILAHGRDHPTVYVPAHDRESATRLEARTTL
jgi:glyoxylase-like metal-dependent hydrolase (beta-lactamase superfamily II)